MQETVDLRGRSEICMQDTRQQRLLLALHCLDLTTLSPETDTELSTDKLCAKAASASGLAACAAVCVLPRFVVRAKSALAGTKVVVATVINFPDGELPFEAVLVEAEQAIRDGADELDVVWDYQAYLRGDVEAALAPIRAVLSAVKDLRPGVRVKVIMETGALARPGEDSHDAVYEAALAILRAFPSFKSLAFLKTSTGKIPIGATPEAVRGILQALRVSNRMDSCGLKISGGVRAVADALAYMALVEDMTDSKWIDSRTFRFGASGLHTAILAALSSSNGPALATSEPGY